MCAAICGERLAIALAGSGLRGLAFWISRWSSGLRLAIVWRRLRSAEAGPVRPKITMRRCRRPQITPLARAFFRSTGAHLTQLSVGRAPDDQKGPLYSTKACHTL